MVERPAVDHCVSTVLTGIGTLEALRSRLGDDPSAWTVREVGDGNLNLVFIVDGPKGSVVVKQALPYVRLVGESWPLPLKRSFFEYHALKRQDERAPGQVPEIFHFDEQAYKIRVHGYGKEKAYAKLAEREVLKRRRIYSTGVKIVFCSILLWSRMHDFRSASPPTCLAKFVLLFETLGICNA